MPSRLGPTPRVLDADALRGLVGTGLPAPIELQLAPSQSEQLRTTLMAAADARHRSTRLMRETMAQVALPLEEIHVVRVLAGIQQTLPAIDTLVVAAVDAYDRAVPLAPPELATPLTSLARTTAVLWEEIYQPLATARWRRDIRRLQRNLARDEIRITAVAGAVAATRLSDFTRPRWGFGFENRAERPPLREEPAQ